MKNFNWDEFLSGNLVITFKDFASLNAFFTEAFDKGIVSIKDLVEQDYFNTLAVATRGFRYDVDDKLIVYGPLFYYVMGAEKWGLTFHTVEAGVDSSFDSDESAESITKILDEIVENILAERVEDIVKEACKNEKIVEQTFSKKDLKPGMLVMARDESLGVIMPSNNGDVIVFDDGYAGWMPLSDYDENLFLLECECEEHMYQHDELDIVAVYGLTNRCFGDIFKTENRDLLFKREDFSYEEEEEETKTLSLPSSAEINFGIPLDVSFDGLTLPETSFGVFTWRDFK